MRYFLDYENFNISCNVRFYANSHTNTLANVNFVHYTIDTLASINFLVGPYYLTERVQFPYNGAFCQGTIIQILHGNPNQYVIEVDVANKYSSLNNPRYNRVTVAENNNILTRVTPINWY